MGQEKGTVMQTSPSYLSISLEVIVSGRALTPRSIVVRTIYTAEGRPTFCIYKKNLKYHLAILRLMCVNAILTFRAPSENRLELAHFLPTNYGEMNSPNDDSDHFPGDKRAGDYMDMMP